jgi:hypothetical protein
MFSDAEVVWLSDPLDPVTVMEKVPVDAFDVVLIVRVVEPAPVTDGGLKLPEAPVGSVDREKFTELPNPFDPLKVTV